MSRASIRYAKAVLSLATDKNVAESVNTDMKNIAKAIADNSELNAVLQSPVVRSLDKKNVLLSVFNNTEALTTDLINTLIENKRIALLGEVAIKYSHLYDAMKETQVATVTTAIPLTKELEKRF